MIANTMIVPQGRQSYYHHQPNYQYVPQNYLPNNYHLPYAPYNPSLSNVQSAPALVYAQPSYSGVQYAPQSYPSAPLGNGYNHLVGLKEPRESERRITYHPYQRAYVDYE